METMTFQLHVPSSVCIIGPSLSGKTYLVSEMIKRRNEVFEKNLKKVLYVYGHYQSLFDQLKASESDIRFTSSIEELENPVKVPTLIVLDDMMLEASKKGRLNDIITRYFLARVHHEQYVFVLILQNGFEKHLRNVALNTQYLGIFNNPRDKSIAYTFGRQIIPSNPRFIVEAYERAVSLRPYGFLWLDLHPQSSNSKFWCRSDLFPTEDCEIYVP